jgi:hemoglobin
MRAGPVTTPLPPDPELAEHGISEEAIARLVATFYARARQDEVIGPIFNSAVADWDHHIANITDFWSSLVLRSGRYQGRPMRPHFMLGLEPQHFDRWLALFESTAVDQFGDQTAQLFISRARRIADSFEMAIGTQRGEVRRPRHSVQ